jgi:hypothetical protein
VKLYIKKGTTLFSIVPPTNNKLYNYENIDFILSISHKLPLYYDVKGDNPLSYGVPLCVLHTPFDKDLNAHYFLECIV